MVTVPPRIRIAVLLAAAAALAAGCASGDRLPDPTPAPSPSPSPSPSQSPSPSDAPPAAVVGAGQSPARLSPAPEWTVRRWLALDPVDRRARVPFNANTPFLRYLLDRAAPPPREGDRVKGDLAECPWRAISSKEDGTVEDENGAWFYGEIEIPMAPVESVFLAHLDGAAVLYVDGAGFVGDLYRLKTGPVPVALHAGVNSLFVAGPRGPWQLRFEPWVEGRSPLLREDATLPELVSGAIEGRGAASLRIVNPSTDWQVVGTIVDQERPPVPPMWVGKSTSLISFNARFAKGRELRWAHEDPGFTAYVGAREFSEGGFSLEERRNDEARRITFTSSIDGTAQYYGYLPPAKSDLDPAKVATVLTLHGAGVDALDQARAYSAKKDFQFVAPTNRRPYGFDWQDWGEQDAYEALEASRWQFGLDPTRVCLTGHSMGGHGTWHLAANNPDGWLAIAPSAGWCSFDTYGGGPRPVTDLTPIWRACDGGSRTEDLVENLVPLPTFVLHGTADEEVPISEAKAMIERIEKAGGHPLHHFEEGAGHWWDGDPAPGAACVDWPGIFDLFRNAAPRWGIRDIDEAVLPHNGPLGPPSIDWTSASPSLDSGHYWVHVTQPLVYGKPFRVRAEGTADGVVATTENVRRIDIDSPGEAPLGRCTIDGQEFPIAEGFLCAAFHREGERWIPDGGGRRHTWPWNPAEKDWNSGPFKRAFDNRFVLVVGTKGTDEENRESMELARFHAETWWYRANGNAPVVRDTDLLARPEEFGDRNLILYGNADTNAAWATVMPESCPVKARRGSLAVGDREWTGDGLGAVFVQPRADGGDITRAPWHALVGAFASTGPRGTRVGYGLSPFVSGVGYPDYAVFGEEFLRSGDGGVLAAGWFDHRWALQPGGFARDVGMREGGK